MKLGNGILDMLVLFLQLFCKIANKIKTKIYNIFFLNVEGKRFSKMESSQDEFGEVGKNQII